MKWFPNTIKTFFFDHKERSISAVIVSIPIFFLLLDPSFAQDSIKKVRHSVKPLNLAKEVSVDEIMAAGQLGGQLFPTDDSGTEENLSGNRKTALKNGNDETRRKINLSFGEAIQEWNKHEYKKAVKLFKKHIEEFPDSPWASEAILHTGCDAQYTGQHTEAEKNFNLIIQKNKGKKTAGSKLLTNKATLRLAVLKVYKNNINEAKELFTQLKTESTDWRDRTYASHWLQRISRDQANKIAMLNCGNQALAYLLEKEGKAEAARAVLGLLPENDQGNSIKTLSEIALKYGYHARLISALPADIRAFPLPAIMHINAGLPGQSGHYWILEKVEADQLTLFDPQADRRYTQTTSQFAREWSGKAMVFAQKGKPVPGIVLTSMEAEETYGGCCGVPRAESDQGNPGQNEGPKSSGNTSPCGAPSWSVNMVNMNLFVTDVPLWYQSPIGPSVQIKLSYNSQSAIAQNEPFGNKWQFNYASYLVVDTGGQVTIFMPDGRRDIYSPDGSGGYEKPYQVHNTLTKIAENHFELRFPDDAVYVYNIPDGTSSLQPFLVEIRDPHQQSIYLDYNTDVLLTTITDATRKVTTLSYNTDGLVTQVTDPSLRSASFEYDANKNLTKITDMGGYSSSLTYDADVYLKSITDERGTWNFYVEPAGGVNAMIKYPAPGAPMWENYRITVTNPSGKKEEYYYDGYYRKGFYVSPRDYINYSSTSVNNYNSPAAKTDYSYTFISGQRGEIYSIKTPAGGTTSYTYDTEGNRTQITRDSFQPTKYSYNALGNVTSTTDAKGITTTMVYDANEVDLKQVTSGLGTVSMTYNSSHELVSITDRLGKITTFTYNDYGQILSQKDAKGIITTYLYDSDKLLQQITRSGQVLDSYTYDNIGRVRTHTDATGLTVTYDYNNLNNIVKITYPDGKFITNTYTTCCPHLIDSTTDRSGRITRYVYDEQKRLIETINPEGGSTRRTYDANGNLIKFVDPNGTATTYNYDLNNRLTKKLYADGNFQSFSYDSRDLLIQKTDPRGITASYSYDANHNLTQTSYSDYSTPAVTYQYDDYNRVIQRQDAIGLWKFTYDANSQVKSIDSPWANDTLSYAYDALGNRTTLTPQGGQMLTYTYDDYSRLTALKIGTSTYSYSYLNANPLVQNLLRPNGSKTTYQYDTLNRLTELANKTSANAIINQYVYAYNQQDVRASEAITNSLQTNAGSAEVTTYDYNRLNQLLSTADTQKLFSYDKSGNMTSGYTSEGYPYSATYDAENRLASILYTSSDGIAHSTEYLYSGDGFLAEMKEYEDDALKNDVRFIRDGLLAVQERGADNIVKREYSWGMDLGGGIGGLLNLKSGGQNYSYLYDGKGNVISLLNSSQTEAARYLYDTFGMPQAKNGSLDQPMRFSTKYFEEKIGLSYYGYRFYAPPIGRWLNRDPLQESGGINLYGFVEGDPVNFIDPNGQWAAALLPILAKPAIGAVSGGASGYALAKPGHKLAGTLIGAGTGALVTTFPQSVGMIGKTLGGAGLSGVGTLGSNYLNGNPNLIDGVPTAMAAAAIAPYISGMSMIEAAGGEGLLLQALMATNNSLAEVSASLIGEGITSRNSGMCPVNPEIFK